MVFWVPGNRELGGKKNLSLHEGWKAGREKESSSARGMRRERVLDSTAGFAEWREGKVELVGW